MTPLEQLNQIARKISPQTKLYEYFQLESQIKKTFGEIPEAERVRVALMSSFTIRPLDLMLTLEAANEGNAVDVYFSEGRQSIQEAMNLQSSFYKFNPEIAIFFLEWYSLIPQSSPADFKNKELENGIGAILELYNRFNQLQKGLFVISNFIVPIDFPYSAFPDKDDSAFTRLNQKLNEAFGSFDNAYILDLEELAQFYGKSRISNPLLKYSSNILFDLPFMNSIVKKLLSVIKSAKSIPKKCIVLDCDNTLWGGVLGEVGLEGIYLSPQGPGSEFFSFQKQIKSLSKRGILLGINSKNNLKDVMNVLEKHPHMVLKKDDFACIKCNWDNKAENMISLSEELNIGLDSIVFIDDDPVQRKLIRDLVPSVKVLDLPNNPTHLPRFLQENNDFDTLNPTFEDLNRAKFYKAKKQRSKLAAQNQSYDDFVQSLSIVLTIGRPRKKDIPRLSQLTMRTNQFNFTTRRYNESEIRTILESKSTKIFYIKSKDIFGDDGIVGLAIALPKRKDIWIIDSFLLSCRVLGRFIEETFLRNVIKKLMEESAKTIQALFIPTAKNIQIPDFLMRMGFDLNTESELEKVYVLNAHNFANPLFSKIKVLEDFSEGPYDG